MATIPVNMGERFRLMAILPEQGNMLTLKTIRVLREKLVPTAEEVVTYNVRQEPGPENIPQLTWDNPDLTQDLEFDDSELELIRATLTSLDKQEQLELRDISLWDKLVHLSPETPKPVDFGG